MYRAVKRVIGWLLTAVLVVIVVGMVSLKVLGWHGFTILSGSMEPSISPGDVVLVQPTAPTVGDVGTFVMPGGDLVTHRVVGMDGDSYITAGDATGSPDVEHRAPQNTVGTVRFVVPKVGWLTSASPWWPWPAAMLVSLALVLLAWPLISRLWSGATQKDSGSEDGTQDATVVAPDTDSPELGGFPDAAVVAPDTHGPVHGGVADLTVVAPDTDSPELGDFRDAAVVAPDTYSHRQGGLRKLDPDCTAQKDSSRSSVHRGRQNQWGGLPGD